MYLLDLSLGSFLFKIVPLCSDTSIPPPLPLLERVLEVLFSKRTKSILQFLLDLLLSKQQPFSCSFIFRKRKKTQGAKSGKADVEV
jgi:hypothetical protein